jgi:hypothetical protein
VLPEQLALYISGATLASNYEPKSSSPVRMLLLANLRLRPLTFI